MGWGLKESFTVFNSLLWNNLAHAAAPVQGSSAPAPALTPAVRRAQHSARSRDTERRRRPHSDSVSRGSPGSLRAWAHFGPWPPPPWGCSAVCLTFPDLDAVWGVLQEDCGMPSVCTPAVCARVEVMHWGWRTTGLFCPWRPHGSRVCILLLVALTVAIWFKWGLPGFSVGSDYFSLWWQWIDEYLWKYLKTMLIVCKNIFNDINCIQ